jgi:hypothetical protein
MASVYLAITREAYHRCTKIFVHIPLSRETVRDSEWLYVESVITVVVIVGGKQVSGGRRCDLTRKALIGRPRLHL